ncbi:hypothetical protein IAF44_20035, partial [Acinetobacter baumannii]|nr:hypothetical protein [Acinetobacter baumannii]
KNNLCRAAQAKLNLTTFLKDNLEESKELYKSIDGAETLDKNYRPNFLKAFSSNFLKSSKL